MTAIENLLQSAIEIALMGISTQVAIGTGTDGNISVQWPSVGDVRDYVLARVDLSSVGLPQQMTGLTIGEIMRALTEQERASAAAVMLQHADLFAIFMEALATGARLVPGDDNFMALIDTLVGYDVLTPQRAAELLGGA